MLWAIVVVLYFGLMLVVYSLCRAAAATSRQLESEERNIRRAQERDIAARIPGTRAA